VIARGGEHLVKKELSKFPILWLKNRVNEYENE
jgi:hypothetical protein